MYLSVFTLFLGKTQSGHRPALENVDIVQKGKTVNERNRTLRSTKTNQTKTNLTILTMTPVRTTCLSKSSILIKIYLFS